MVALIIIVTVVIWIMRSSDRKAQEVESREWLISSFIRLYGEQTGVYLTRTQAIALIQVAYEQLRVRGGGRFDIEDEYLDGKLAAEILCEQAERDVRKRY